MKSSPLLAVIETPPPLVWYTVAGICGCLLLGSAVRLFALRGATAEFRVNRLGSLRSWWMIVLIFSAALLLGRVGIILFFTLVSLLAVREYMTLTKAPYANFGLAPFAVAITLLNYLWIYLDWQRMFLVFVPLAGLILLSVRMVIQDRGKDFLLTAASLHWGLLLTVYSISHAALLLNLPDASQPVGEGVGWVLYLLVLTSLSDISQALIGRRWGKRPVAPVLSPHKTQLGLWGGVAVTTSLGVLLAPYLTSLPDAELPGWKSSPSFMPGLLAGFMIGLAGYFGDITISGVKRDVNVKDSGTLLPGQGGLLDRIDSLTFTAPLFYYFVLLLRGL